MKRLVIPLVIFASVALIILSGWLGYASVTGPIDVNLPLTAASPTPNTSVRIVTVARGDVRQVLTVPGEVTPARQQQLGFSASGRLVDLTVRAGDLLNQGQTLARLDQEPLKLALAQAQADLDVKQATLDKLRAGPTASDLASANAAVKDAQTALQNSQFNLTVVQNSSTVTQAVRDREVADSPDGLGIRRK